MSLLSKGLTRVFSSTTIQKHQFFAVQPSLWSNSLICTWILEKPLLWLYGHLLAVMSLLFHMLPRLVIAFLPRSKRLLISWLQSPSAVILEPKKIKSVTISIYLYIYKLDLPANEKSYLSNWKVDLKKYLNPQSNCAPPLLGLIFKISRIL